METRNASSTQKGDRQDALSAAARLAFRHAETKDATALIADMATLLDLGGIDEGRAIAGFLRDEFPGDAKIVEAALDVVMRHHRHDLVAELGLSEDDPRLLCRPARTQDIWINLTSRCNLRCVYCTTGKPGHVDQDISADSLAKTMAFIRERRPARTIVGCYTETTAYQGWTGVVREIIDLGIDVHIISNLARMLDFEEIDTFARCRRLQTSIDTMDRDRLKEVRRGADIRTILYNILRIRGRALELGRTPPPMEWICVPTRENLAGLMEYVACAIAAGVASISVNPVLQFEDSQRKFPDLLDLPDAELCDAFGRFEAAAAFARKHGVAFSLANRDLIEERLRNEANDAGRTPPARAELVAALGKVSFYARRLSAGRTRLCTQPWDTVVLSERGELYPCTICGTPLVRLDEVARVEDALRAPAVLQWKRDLLAGAPAQACVNCLRAPEGDAAELAAMVRKLNR